MLVQVLRIVAEPRSRIVADQRNPLRLDSLTQTQRSRLAGERWPGNQRLAVDDAFDQARDLGRRCEPVVARLPFLDALAARQAKPPDHARLDREPRDRHPEPLEVTVDRVVPVLDRELALGAKPVVDVVPAFQAL